MGRSDVKLGDAVAVQATRFGVGLQSALLSVVLTVSATAFADPGAGSFYCRKVQAKAGAEQALLLAPRLLVQGLRYPTGQVLDPNTFGVAGVQMRAGLSFSATDFVKGLLLPSIADSDCERQDSQTELESLMESASHWGERPALDAQVAYLIEKQRTWAALLEAEEQLFARRAVTLLELNEFRARITELERRLSQTRGRSAQMASEENPTPRPLAEARARYLSQVERFERNSAGARALDAFGLRVWGGASISDRPTDWFAVAEFTVSLGGIHQAVQDRRYVAARLDEATQARYELGDRSKDLEQRLKMQKAQALEELKLLDTEIAGFEKTRTSLETISVHGADHAIGVLKLEEISKGADRVYLRRLVESLSQYLSQDASAS